MFVPSTPSRLRPAGIALILAVGLGALGILAAMIAWQGPFYVSGFLLRDLGASECTTPDSAYVRYVCSPGHLWFRAGCIAAAALLLLAGHVLWWRGHTQGEGAKDAQPVRIPGARTLALWCVLVAACLGFDGLWSVTKGEGPMDVTFTLCAVGSAVAMAWQAWLSFRHQPLLPGPAPVVARQVSLVTLLLVSASLCGFVFYVASPIPSAFGSYQYLTLGPIALWMLMVGAGLARR